MIYIIICYSFGDFSSHQHIPPLIHFCAAIAIKQEVDEPMDTSNASQPAPTTSLDNNQGDPNGSMPNGHPLGNPDPLHIHTIFVKVINQNNNGPNAHWSICSSYVDPILIQIKI